MKKNTGQSRDIHRELDKRQSSSDSHHEAATQCGSYCNLLDSVWVVWKRRTERYGYGTKKCDSIGRDFL